MSPALHCFWLWFCRNSRKKSLSVGLWWCKHRHSTVLMLMGIRRFHSVAPWPKAHRVIIYKLTKNEIGPYHILRSKTLLLYLLSVKEKIQPIKWKSVGRHVNPSASSAAAIRCTMQHCRPVNIPTGKTQAECLQHTSISKNLFHAFHQNIGHIFKILIIPH